MRNHLRIYIIAALVFLAATLIFGLLASWAFLYPETYNKFLPFYQLRPFHVSAALFWIISGATAGLLYYKNNEILPCKAQSYNRAGIYIYMAIYYCRCIWLLWNEEIWRP
jgi:nitric oxide reductase large subunit